MEKRVLDRRLYAVSTARFTGDADGRVKTLHSTNTLSLATVNRTRDAP